MINIKTSSFIWIIFYLLLTMIFVTFCADIIGLRIAKYIWFKLFLLCLPVILLLFHSFYTLSAARGIMFIVIASATGLIMEILGLKNGVIFGGHYIYQSNQPTIASVPLSVVLFWAVFIYTGYCMVNSFLIWTNREKPNIKHNNYWLLPLLIVADGLIVVAIDLFMDPLEVYAGNWRWLEGGPYYGIPVGNFIGWFCVTAIATAAYRSFEYFVPNKEPTYDKSVFVIPVLLYGILSLCFAMAAIKHQMLGLALLGSILMMPTVIVNLLLFRKRAITLTNNLDKRPLCAMAGRPDLLRNS
ncbi:MAG: carotenoid biosynthesis protein [Kiritimatiellaeota bacterium]|nr:carotenoid biosynthesis protein [Kiritimatiellota bacterium]